MTITARTAVDRLYTVEHAAGHLNTDERLARPPLAEYFKDQYRAAQTTSADHVLDTDDLPAADTARQIAVIAGLTANHRQ